MTPDLYAPESAWHEIRGTKPPADTPPLLTSTEIEQLRTCNHITKAAVSRPLGYAQLEILRQVLTANDDANDDTNHESRQTNG